MHSDREASTHSYDYTALGAVEAAAERLHLSFTRLDPDFLSRTIETVSLFWESHCATLRPARNCTPDSSEQRGFFSATAHAEKLLAEYKQSLIRTCRESAVGQAALAASRDMHQGGTSAYELTRLENIRRNEVMLVSLGLGRGGGGAHVA